MCSIMGYCSADADIDAFMEGFNRTISRGPDSTRIVDTGRGLLGFHRLSIMGLPPAWASDLPLRADGDELTYYRKM